MRRVDLKAKDLTLPKINPPIKRRLFYGNVLKDGFVDEVFIFAIKKNIHLACRLQQYHLGNPRSE
jgi:hypothetical protein